MELEERYKELEDRFEATRIDLEGIAEQKEEERMEAVERGQHQKEKLEERIARLEQEVMDY